MFRTITDIFPDWDSGKGIFYYLDALTPDMPWGTYDENMDVSYVARSGDKTVSPIVRKLLEEDGTLSATNAAKLASVIWLRYGESWTRLFATLDLEYDPISNYDMHETSSEAETGSKQSSDTHADQYQRDSALNSASSQASASKGDTGIFGFDSDSSVPANDSSSSTGGAGLGTDTGTETEGRSGSSMRDEGQTAAKQHVLQRSGNIGVTSSQQLLQSERELWTWSIWDTIYHDIDRVLTLRVYS